MLLCSGWPKGVVCDDDAFPRILRRVVDGWRQVTLRVRGAGVTTATMLRVALFARSGAARGAGRLVGGRLVDAGEAGEGAQPVDENGPQNHPTSNAMAPKVDLGQNRFSATGDSLLFRDTCAVLRKCFRSRAVGDKSGCGDCSHGRYPYATGPMHAGTQLEQVGGCAPIAVHSRAKRRVSLDGDQLGCRGQNRGSKHLNIRSLMQGASSVVL